MLFLTTLALAAAPQLGLHLAHCAQGRHKVAARCGTFGVYENRDTHKGRIIALNVVVIPAVHPSNRAVVWLQGGPGGGSAQDVPAIADGLFEKEMMAMHDGYNLLFLDNRGTGMSNPSDCDVTPAADPAAYFKQLWPEALLRACRAAYAKRADVKYYNTDYAEDDLDDLRAALGYPKLVLSGGSYGTFDALVYMRRHPQHVESAVLDGVASPHFMPIPGEPEGAQTALDDLAAKCSRDPRCHARFPHFAQQFAAFMKRLNAGPVAVTLKNKHLKHAQTVLLSKEVFVDHLRQAMYSSESAAFVPFVIDRAAKGDTGPLAKVIDLVARAFGAGLDAGALLSYSCAEDVPFIDPRAVEQEAAHSFAGDVRFRAQERACRLWNVPVKPASFNDPVRSTAPVLMLSGSDDPATPPKFGESELPYLPNGRALLVRGAGHGVENACTDAIVVRFIKAHSARGLDLTTCRGTFMVPKFETSAAGLPDF